MLGASPLRTLRAPSQNVLPSSYYESAAPPAGWAVGAAGRGNRLTRAKWQCQNSSTGDHWTACALLGSLQAPSACHVSVGPFRGEEGEFAPNAGAGPGFRHGRGGGGEGHGSWKSWKGKGREILGSCRLLAFFAWRRRHLLFQNFPPWVLKTPPFPITGPALSTPPPASFGLRAWGISTVARCPSISPDTRFSTTDPACSSSALRQPRPTLVDLDPQHAPIPWSWR